MIPSPSKRLLKKVIRQCGYEMTPITRVGSSSRFPYVRSYAIGDCAFQFWIAQEEYVIWYDIPTMEQAVEGPALCDLLQVGDRVLEVGCHHGFFTVQMANKVGATGKIVSLEADPYNVMVAQAQMSLNHCGDRCEILYRAGSDQSGTLQMEATADHNTSAAGRANAVTRPVEAVRGDDLEEAYGPFDLLKVDVEGYEKQVLMGCKSILSRRPCLAIELHLALMRDFAAAPGDIFDLIDVDRYEGHLMTPARTTELTPFDPRNLPEEEIVNLFLRPKHKE